MVGLAGVEPTTSCTPSKRATRLRYSPKSPVYTVRTGGAESGTLYAMRHCRIALAAALFSTLALAQNPFYLKDGDRVVFYGDSITDQRLYTTFTESYVVTRFPGLNISFTHSGWGGDRVSGGSGGPIDLRLTRDVFPYQPTVITIMLGMNDGGYRAFDEAVFSRYTSGFEHILDAIKTNAPTARITLIQPSPYDDATRPPTFEGGYNAVLLKYSEYLGTLAQSRHLDVADLNRPVSAMLKRAADTNKDEAQKILPDRVHPAPAGHLIMAEALLKAWNAPALVSDVRIDAQAHTFQATNAKVEALTAGTPVSWTATESALPLPIDPKDKLMDLAVRSSDVVDALDQETLGVTGLAPGKWDLKIDGLSAGSFAAEDLAKGVNLATLSTPMLKQALDVHALTLKHNNIHFMRWRTIQTGLATDASPNTKQNATLALDQLDNELIAEQRAAAQPRSHHYELIPVN
jgi:lysophospholipase L1-like esterase